MQVASEEDPALAEPATPADSLAAASQDPSYAVGS